MRLPKSPPSSSSSNKPGLGLEGMVEFKGGFLSMLLLIVFEVFCLFKVCGGLEFTFDFNISSIPASGSSSSSKPILQII